MARNTPQLADVRPDFENWQKVGDMIDQMIDIMLNYRQSGHPGGSRSKVPAMVALTLGGIMRWDIRRAELPLADRFVLIAGHVTPLAYGMLAVYNEALRRMHAKTGDAKYLVQGGEERTLLWEDLLTLRNLGGLSGHAEHEGKTLFFASNTGPSGHGGPAAAGIALALKHAGADEVRVFGIEGEGGLTAGCHHETKLTAYGLGLSNLVYMIDWNDNGIDPRKISDMVYGEPQEWFDSYGWETRGADDGADYEQVFNALAGATFTENDKPKCAWFKTEKGRGYGVTGFASHGAPNKSNNEVYWATKKEFADKYGVNFSGMGESRTDDAEAFKAQNSANFQEALSLLDDDNFCAWLADKLVSIGESVPEALEGVTVNDLDPNTDPELTDPNTLPADMFYAAGDNQPNRAGFAKIGAHLNAVARRKYGRPVVIACSADLAGSTNINGFANDSGDSKGFGWYERNNNVGGALLPTTITEMGNAGIMAGMAGTNLSTDPENKFAGYWGAMSTYGSFSYLKYGPMRLYSQMCQDSPHKHGKVIWVAGHSGPETAEDSRTHFGVFSPAVTQLFPKGQVIDIHPWEPNEVGPALMAALGTDAPIVALHLTRPPVEVPDREALGMGSYMDAAKGAYLIRDYDNSRSQEGCVFVRGTSSTGSLMQLVKEGWFDKGGPNVKLVAAISADLFDLQDKSYQDSIASPADWFNSTFITNGARQTMERWSAHRTAMNWSMGSDHDDRWRSGGSIPEVIADAKLDVESIREHLTRFAAAKAERFASAGAPETASV